jgi:23S rRNA (adenine2503-C2)-methyltransferase
MKHNHCLKALTGLNLSEIEAALNTTEFLSRLPGGTLPRFRVKQIYKWISRGAGTFEEMTDIPVSLQKELNCCFTLFSSTVADCLDDGETKKMALSLYDGTKVEAVLLSDGKERMTACISTQVGCPAGCVFCKTGSLGFKRNLNNTEIVEQFLHLKSKAAFTKTEVLGQTHLIDNIVIMGMGEPLLNLANLRKAIAIFTDPAGLNFSKRRITVSTCGICEGLFDIANNGPFIRLALSLVTADEPLRQKLMPITKTNPLEKVKEALVLFQRNGGSRITLELPLLCGINTRDKDARSIASFAKGIETVVNLIPWNPVAGLKFEGNFLQEPCKKETEAFIRMLEKYGLKVTIRLHKGQRIMGACGQLGSL